MIYYGAVFAVNFGLLFIIDKNNNNTIIIAGNYIMMFVIITVVTSFITCRLQYGEIIAVLCC